MTSAPKLDILDTKEAAARLKVTPRQVRQWASTGWLPGVKVGWGWVFRAADLEAFEQRRRKRGAQPGLANPRARKRAS